MGNELEHVFTLGIDWEDFGQLLCRDRCGLTTKPSDSIERQTHAILDLLDEARASATFFILGMLAAERPQLVIEIAKRGHEIALHAQNHLDLRKLDRANVVAEIRDAWNIVTDIIGTAVYGFRAPYFSVDCSNLYVLDVVAECGMLYDSSIVPVKVRRYGIDNFGRMNTLYQLPSGNQIVELPLAVGSVGARLIPVAGGGYIRLLPHWAIRALYHSLHRQQADVNMYMHPYEFDAEELDCQVSIPEKLKRAGFGTTLLNLKWNVFRQSIRPKMHALLTRYKFSTCLERALLVKRNAKRATVLGSA